MRLSEILKSKYYTCDIPYCDLKTMLDMTSETAADEKRRAITFCGNGQELSFPEATGEEEGVEPASCPIGQEKLGTFVTHQRDIPAEKTMLDWYHDMEERTAISCVGTASRPTPAPTLQSITCHTFNRSHPEYEDFRRRLMEASLEAELFEGKISDEMIKEHRVPWRYRASYLEHTKRVGELIDEGIKKGIMGNCVPMSHLREKLDTFAMSDIKGAIEEQTLAP